MVGTSRGDKLRDEGSVRARNELAVIMFMLFVLMFVVFVIAIKLEEPTARCRFYSGGEVISCEDERGSYKAGSFLCDKILQEDHYIVEVVPVSERTEW